MEENTTEQEASSPVFQTKSLLPGHRRVWFTPPHSTRKVPVIILKERKGGLLAVVKERFYNRFKDNYEREMFVIKPEWICEGYVGARVKADERKSRLHQLPLKLASYIMAHSDRCVSTAELIQVFGLRTWEFYKAKESFGDNIVFNKLTGWRYRVGLELALLLAAISAVESGNNDRAIGKAGEISRYQISPVVWEKYSKVCDPSRKGPTDLVVASQIAAAHIATIRAAIPTKIQQDEGEEVFWIAACWNAGVRGATNALWIKSRLPGPVQDYAERVQNIFVALQQEKARKQTKPEEINP